MELVKNTFLDFDGKNLARTAALPIGVLVLMAMMVLPLPVYLLDTFFITNIIISLLVLMVAVNTQRPLDFSSFPNLLNHGLYAQPCVALCVDLLDRDLGG